MKRPAIFFDRDNTLIVSDGYLGDPAKVVLMDGAADAIAAARSLGFAAVVVSNQSGVARGMFGEEAVHAVNDRLDQMLADQNKHAIIDRHEFCPYHPEATVDHYRQESDLRKPKPGMIVAAAEKLALDLSRSWLIGDAPRDIKAGKAAGCRTILFTPNGVAASPAAAPSESSSSDERADHAVTRLKDAIEYVAQHLRPPPSDGEESSVNPGSSEQTADARPAMSIAQHQSLPPRIESAARVNDADMSAATTPPHPRATPIQTTTSPRDSDERMLTVSEQILDELRRRNEQPVQDFSVSKMLAGIVQVMTLAILFIAYLNRNEPMPLLNTLVLALTLQTMTIALLIMSRQR